MRRVLALVGCALGILLLGAAAVTGALAYVAEDERLTAPLARKGDVKHVYWQERQDAFYAEFGQYPPRSPYTPEERETAREFEVVLLGEQLRAQFPGTELPDAAFEDYDAQARAACLAAEGVAVAVDDWGLPSAMGDSAESALVVYSCFVRHAVEPHIRPDDASLRWVYRYWTSYLLPCLEAHGVAQAVPIAEEEFVARYPRQGWSPQTPSGPDDRVDPGWASTCD